MNGNEEEQVPRPRPLSGGIWTIFSWLRRSERSSSESISSVGSDRTVASFDFLAPTEYDTVYCNGPRLILPTNIPTDTYKKRLEERELRRQRDRDLTLHRKYGLTKFEAYETFSLPSSYSIRSGIETKNEKFRQRRATSEYYSPRAAYVPGKRRAPQPPVSVTAATLPRYKRKRPAPKPPNVFLENNKENQEQEKTLQMNKNSANGQEFKNVIPQLQRPVNTKEQDKVCKDKGFLKQIFDSRKRISTIDKDHIKLLPSISELDKQAFEIIETNKAFRSNKKSGNTDSPWICTKCLRKYQGSIVNCTYCQAHEKNEPPKRFSVHTETDVSLIFQTKNSKVDDKEKLKEMLKEMKHSLPKRSKQNIDNAEDKIFTESSTIRISSNQDRLKEHPSTSRPTDTSADINLHISKILNDCKAKSLFLNSDINITTRTNSNTPQKISILESKQKNKVHMEKVSIFSKCNGVVTTENLSNLLKHEISSSSNTPKLNEKEIISGQIREQQCKKVQDAIQKAGSTKNSVLEEREQKIFTESKIIQTPLKISALLNSVNSDANKVNNNSLPKVEGTPNKDRDKIVEQINVERSFPPNEIFGKVDNEVSTISTNSKLPASSSFVPFVQVKNVSTEASKQLNKVSEKVKKPVQDKQIGRVTPLTSDMLSNITERDDKITDKSLEIINHHSRRRTLVNQLEQSISKGDEKTAAKAAAELAKLRLSCSVLSFSSQIAADVLDSNNREREASCSSVNHITGTPLLQEKDRPSTSVTNVKIPLTSNGKDQIKRETISSRDSEIKLAYDLATPSSIRGPSSNNGKATTLSDPTQVKPSSSVTNPNDLVPIQVWVEDKETARGPVRLLIQRNAVMADLMRQCETSLGLAINLQRWIVGRNLCTDDKTSLSTLAGVDLTAPFYLCLVESGPNSNNLSKQNETIDSKINEQELTIKDDEKSGEVYRELMKLEKEAIVLNTEQFECEVCMELRPPGEGVVLRECIHLFCKTCLTDAIRHCEEPVLSCPAVGCIGELQEREIRALLPHEEYERWLARSLAAAECGTRNTFHCRTTDCKGWAFCEPGVRKFPCPVCKHTNCIPCKASHEGKTCEQYQETLRKVVSVAEKSQIDEGTQAFLNSLIRKGEALECPECNSVITKKWGCDWVKCSACKTEICWVTRGRRWGPGGKGDTSGGCQCGVDGKRCHPTCGYCH